uniref:Dynein 2 intermediate chain 2 n=1 Tax=Tetraodon nigroviridis TaxID=99883 RepID=H3CBU1_TETNG
AAPGSASSGRTSSDVPLSPVQGPRMLADEALEAVSVQSRWRSSRLSSLETRACQTRRVHTAEAEVQTLSTAETGSQTEAGNPAAEPEDPDPDPGGLKDFLGRVEDTLVRQLLRNSRSHAFDGFQVNWSDPSHLVSLRHCLQHPAGVQRSLQVTKVSWSCTGAVLACAYGRIDDGDWSTEAAHVCTWNLLSPKLQPGRAEAVIDVPAAVSALSCHPTHAALLAGAGGLYSGRVVVWDTGRTDEPVLAQTGISAEGHREPVCEQVVWVPQQKSAELGLLSACSQGKVLLWRRDAEQRALVLSAAFTLDPQQIPRSLKGQAQGCGSVGLTSLALSSWDWDTVLVGSEGGLLLRCSLPTGPPWAAPPRASPHRAALFSFSRSSGPIYSIHPSPFHWGLFVSGGTDGLAHLHSLQQSAPLLSLKVCDSYVFQVQWSPSRPLVFAAATAEGLVQVFDLGRRSPRPVATLEGGGAAGGGVAATCLAFNTQNAQLLAVGRANGSVDVWHLSTDLTEQRPREAERLQQIANRVAA